MDVPGIRHDIVTARQAKAAAIQTILATAHTLSQRLSGVRQAMAALTDLDTPDLKAARGSLNTALDAVEALMQRAQIRYDRFQSGLVTVSIAGLEKAGKTTFLKSLTGIDTLPTFDERCTAVCCEIHYSESRSDFDIEFYTEAEFLDRIIAPTLETIAADLPTAMREDLAVPGAIDGFPGMRLPDTTAVSPGTTAYKLLSDLRALQTHFQECKAFLGRPPLLKQPLASLREWVSYRPSSSDPDADDMRRQHLARISAAKVCRIHTRFAGGSPHLRWIDTPGVDDPNRRARDLTLATIAAETDLLVVASRPGANPSPNENFHNFWDSVSRQPDEVTLLNRMLFVLNCDRRVDPDGENVRIHQKYLMDAGVPRHLFVGPLEAPEPEDALRLMERVNAHLQDHLPGQDDLVIQTFESQLKTLQAKIRLLHNTLAKSHPSDAGQFDQEAEAFHKWFHWYADGKDTGFWSNLVSALDWSTRDILEDERIKASESALNAIFSEAAAAIQEKIPLPEHLEDYLVTHRGENPVPEGMRQLSILFSKLVNRLASEIQEFGPIMQDKLVQVLSRAGLAPLLEGDTTEAKLSTLLDHLNAETGASSVTEVLEETRELPKNLKYVIRYELRPAVDFLDPTLWNADQASWTRLKEMVTANGGDVGRLAAFDTLRHPPVNDTREKDHETLKKIAGNALYAIHTALGNERYLPRRIADDYIRDCRVRLCFSPESEQEWRTLLFRSRGALLSHVLGDIRRRSERIAAFQRTLNDLEISLP